MSDELTTDERLVLETIYRWECEPFVATDETAESVSPVPTYLIWGMLHSTERYVDLDTALRTLVKLEYITRADDVFDTYYPRAAWYRPDGRVLDVHRFVDGWSVRKNDEVKIDARTQDGVTFDVRVFDDDAGAVENLATLDTDAVLRNFVCLVLPFQESAAVTLTRDGVLAARRMLRPESDIRADYKSVGTTIEAWQSVAAEEVDDIGAWRDADPNKLAYHYWTGGASSPPRRPEPPRNFFSQTTYLVSWITTHYPKLDPTPLQDIYTAVTVWHQDHSAARIPPQAALFATLERAVTTLQAVETDLRSRLVHDDEPSCTAGDGKPDTPADGAASAYTVAALRGLTGLANTTLNRYAKRANVTTPRRGQRNFSYSAGDVRAILNKIIKTSSEDKLITKCRDALRKLQKIAE